jgi:signal transduction histidine kinase
VRLTSSFLREYRSTGRPTARSERVLAVGRAFLTVSAFVAIYLDPTEPARLQEITYGVLLAYALYSLGALALVHGSTRLTARHGQVLHAMDVLWTSALTFVSEGPVSPFFLFFLFVVLAAAYRWGFRETVATAVVTVAVFLVETLIVSVGPWHPDWLSSIEFELNRTILRVAYLLLTGFLLGYLAEEEKQSQAEVAAIADATRLPRVDLGLGGSITAIARGLVSMFDAASAAVVFHDCETRRTLLWTLEAPGSGANALRPRRVELDPQQHGVWLFDDPGRAWTSVRGKGGRASVRVTEAGMWPLKRVDHELPAAFVSARSFRTVTAVNMELGREWHGRVYLFDVRQTGGSERSLHFLEALAEHVTPALTNVFLLRRLRARAGAAERARVARELHDGAIQALFGIEMKIAALRRAAETDPANLATELEAIQDLIRLEILELRDLMQALRPVELDGDQLPDVLAGMVERFRRDTGVSARFVSSGGRPALSMPIAIEVVRIVQEALVNVRKHSQARNVLVRLTRDDHGCTVVIEDDGCGFEFEGRLTGEELERGRFGPAIIKERARIAGVRLAVDSTPGEGARVELTFREAHV